MNGRTADPDDRLIIIDSDPVERWVPVFDLDPERSEVTAIGAEPILTDELAAELRETEATDQVLDQLISRHPEDEAHPVCEFYPHRGLVTAPGVVCDPIGWGYLDPERDAEPGAPLLWNATLVIIPADGDPYYLCEGCAAWDAQVRADARAAGTVGS